MLVVGEVEAREEGLEGDVTVDLGEEGLEVAGNPKILAFLLETQDSIDVVYSHLFSFLQFLHVYIFSNFSSSSNVN